MVRDADWRGLPGRLPGQPIFYPVLEESYAVQIARDWNTRNGGTGHVLCFEVETEYLRKYPVQTVTARMHREYWIPAEDLVEFNRHLVGQIKLVSTFRSA